MSRVESGNGYRTPLASPANAKSGTDWLMFSSVTMALSLVMFLLSTVVVPRVAGRAATARMGAANSDLHVLAGALRNFKLDNDRYPTEDEGLDALVVRPRDCSTWKGPYVEGALPVDPWHRAYVYEAPSQTGEGSFEIESLGRDGAPGGSGEDADIAVKDE